jgi:pyocin large subunit-like protein
VPNFADGQVAFRHYAKHSKGVKVRNNGKLNIKPGGADPPEFSSIAEYSQAARRFHSGSPRNGVLEGVRPGGDFVRFDPQTGYFGVRSPDGTIRTFFRPEGNVAAKLQYFFDQF